MERQVTRKELSQRLDVSQTRVRNLLNDGVLPTQDGTKKVDLLLCAQAVLNNVEDATSRIHIAATKIVEHFKKMGEVELSEEEQATPNLITYNTARAKKEHFKALQEELNYQKAVGELLPAADIEKAATRTARIVRDALLSIPDRCSALCAAETDPNRVHMIIADEVENVLKSLSQ